MDNIKEKSKNNIIEATNNISEYILIYNKLPYLQKLTINNFLFYARYDNYPGYLFYNEGSYLYSIKPDIKIEHDNGIPTMISYEDFKFNCAKQLNETSGKEELIIKLPIILDAKEKCYEVTESIKKSSQKSLKLIKNLFNLSQLPHLIQTKDIHDFMFMYKNELMDFFIISSLLPIESMNIILKEFKKYKGLDILVFQPKEVEKELLKKTAIYKNNIYDNFLFERDYLLNIYEKLKVEIFNNWENLNIVKKIQQKEKLEKELLIKDNNKTIQKI